MLGQRPYQGQAPSRYFNGRRGKASPHIRRQSRKEKFFWAKPHCGVTLLISHHRASTYNDHGRDHPIARGFCKNLRQTCFTLSAANPALTIRASYSNTDPISLRKRPCIHFSNGSVKPIFGLASRSRGNRSATASASNGLATPLVPLP